RTGGGSIVHLLAGGHQRRVVLGPGVPVPEPLPVLPLRVRVPPRLLLAHGTIVGWNRPDPAGPPCPNVNGRLCHEFYCPGLEGVSRNPAEASPDSEASA